MSNITNDALTRSDTGCFIVVHVWQQRASKGKRSHRCWTECYASSLLQQCTVPRVNLILYIKQ